MMRRSARKLARVHEMAPSVRVPWRRIDSSAYAREGHWRPHHGRVISMMQALANFIEDLDRIQG